MSRKSDKRFIRILIDDFTKYLDNLKNEYANMEDGETSHSDSDSPSEGNDDTVVSSKVAEDVGNICNSLKSHIGVIQTNVNTSYRHFKAKKEITSKRAIEADNSNQIKNSESQPVNSSLVNNALNNNHDDNNLAKENNSRDSTTPTISEKSSVNENDNCNTNTNKFSLKIIQIEKLLKPGITNTNVPNAIANHAPVTINLDSDSDSNSNFQDAVAKLESDDDADDDDDDAIVAWKKNKPTAKKISRVIDSDSDDDVPLIKTATQAKKLKTISPTKSIDAGTESDNSNSAKVSTTKKSKKDKKDKKSKTNVLKRVEKNCVVTIEHFPNTLEALLDKFNLDSVDDVNNENISPENYKKIFLNRDQETLLNHRRKIIGDEKPKAMKRRKSHKKKKSTKKELKTKNNRKKMSENNNRYDSDEDDESSKQTYSTEKEEDNDIRCLKTSSSSDNSSSSSSSSSSSGSGSSSSSGSGGSSSSSSSSDDSDDNEEKTEKQVSASKKRKYLNGEGSVVAAAVRAITANNDDEDDEAETVQEDANENNAESDNEEEDDEDENVVNVKQEEELDLDDNAEEREDEEDEELFQPKKKKIKTDASVKEDQQTNEKKGRKRRRIKKVSSSEDENDDKNSPNKGRKNIRKLLTKDSLDATTKQAAREERERKMRIEERQKMYNQIYDGKPEEIKELNKLVLDFDEETKEVLLEADKKLVKKLKPHQATGIKFMFDACFESMERMHNSEGSGCILAHCMGLGKTLQVITLCHTLLSNSDRTNVNRILVVCPLSTVLNWVNEFKIWLKHVDKNDDLEIYEISKYKQNIDRANKLMEWHNDGGVMILGYEMFRNLTNDTGTKLKKKIKQSLQTSLVDPGPDLIVCDEGHLLKNEKTSLSKAMNRIRTQRRIVLTGTPLQNNLKEYYCMVTFVKPNLLGKYNEYMNRFVNPITNGQYTDSTERDIQIMKRRSHVLHKMLDGCVQRKDYSVLAPFLPPKHEYVVSVRLTKMQIELYEYYMQNKSMLVEQQNQKRSSILFTDFQNLQRIWTHPRVLRYNSDKYEQVQAKKREMESEEESEGSLKNFIDDDDEDEEEASSSSDSDSVQSVNSDDSYNPKKKKNVRPPRRTRATYKVEDDPVEVKKKEDNPTEWWMQICPEDQLDNIEHSGKLKILFSILEECEAIGDKLLVFSQSLYSLDVIEHFLALSDNKGSQSWSLGLDYFRLDGSTSVENRSLACNIFNQVDNPRARLFLISTRAGGLGINLTAANRVIIFDVSWNPSHDIQSIFRVYRFGQDKPCYVYRFLAMGTMEEKIYERQVTKQAISKRVIDEQQIDRHYKENDLQELYRYELVPTEPRSIPSLPKDRLFAELFKKYEDIIFKFHEHDSLLENKEEETLNEEERKAAWDEFEAEKNRPVQTYNFIRGPGTGPVTSNNIYGLRSDILLRLLSLKARHDHPQFDDLQIKSMIPILMQELHSQMAQGEITLYQSLLTFLSELEVPQYGYNPMLNNMIGNYNNMIAAANAASGSHSHTSNNIAPLSTTMTPTQLNIMRLINQQKMMEQEQQHASLMNAMPQQQSGGIEQHNHMIEQAQNRLMNLKKTNIPPSATIEID